MFQKSRDRQEMASAINSAPGLTVGKSQGQGLRGNLSFLLSAATLKAFNKNSSTKTPTFFLLEHVAHGPHQLKKLVLTCLFKRNSPFGKNPLWKQQLCPLELKKKVFETTWGGKKKLQSIKEGWGMGGWHFFLKDYSTSRNLEESKRREKTKLKTETNRSVDDEDDDKNKPNNWGGTQNSSVWEFYRWASLHSILISC